MAVAFEEIISFIQTETGTAKNISRDTVIEADLGCTGDDFFELIEKYAQKFNVNIESYLWYFHAPEEPSFNPGALFFKPPYGRVKRIPVTAGMLKDFADQGIWNIAYPAHTLPSHRFDIYFAWLILAAVPLVLVCIRVLSK